MANDNKIKKALIPVGAKFLPEEIVNADGLAEVYSLENEFASTKKNKNWMVFFIFLVFIFLIFILTSFFTYYSNIKDRNIDVSISEFEDLRLKEVLNSARLTENNLQIRKNELESLIIEMKNKILEINNIYLARENAILDRGYPDNVAREKIAESRKAEQAEVVSVRSGYEGNINSKRALVNEMEKEKMIADRRLEKENTKLNKSGDENKVYAMKMKSLSDSYKSGLTLMSDYYERYIRYLILKYNPVFTSGEIKTNLDRNYKKNENISLKDYNEVFQKENVLSRKRFDDLHLKISDQSVLLQRLMGVGYENSVPPTLKSIDNLSKSIVNDYESLWFGLVSTVKQKNIQIEDYRIALDAVLKEKPESGYIISANNPSRISIHINRLLTVQEGDTGMVFRTDDQYIGRIEFYKTTDGLKAKVVSLAGSMKMRPFDRILIKIK